MKTMCVRALAVSALTLAALVALPATAAAQMLPPVGDFLRFLDVRCYDIPDQPPLGVFLHLDHLNPLFVDKGLPPEDVILQEPQQLCVPVAKNNFFPTAAVMPFIRFVDLKCYGIEDHSLDLPLRLDHLNPVIANLFGPSLNVVVREPQQLCVPVAKNLNIPPPAVRRLVEFLDVKCYRIETNHFNPDHPIQLTHLNPLFAGIPPELATILAPVPVQLCVPVAKNNLFPPADIRPYIENADLLCYKLKGLPLDRDLRLDHLNPVLRQMGLPPEFVKVTESEELCVPVRKSWL